MKILIKGMTINSIPWGIIGYDIDKTMVYFGIGRWKEEIFFESREDTVQFMAELIMAKFNGLAEIDMTHHKVYFENIHFSQSKESHKKENTKNEKNENI